MTDQFVVEGSLPSTLILRHGPTTWNQDGRWQGGEVDNALSADGRALVHRLAGPLRGAGVDRRFRLVSSPMARACETAEILRLRGVGHGPIAVVDGLREARIGTTSGLTEPEVEQRFPEVYSTWRDRGVPTYPDGESLPDLAARVGSALAGIAEFDSLVVAIAHVTVLRAIRLIVGLAAPPLETHLSGVGCWRRPGPGGRAIWKNIDQLAGRPATAGRDRP